MLTCGSATAVASNILVIQPAVDIEDALIVAAVLDRPAGASQERTGACREGRARPTAKSNIVASRN